MTQESTENKKEINWLAIAGTLFAALSGVALFLGYGVTLAVESVFGMPHAAIFESSVELFDLSSIALLEIIPTVIKFISSPQSYILLYKENSTSLIAISGVIFLVLMIIGVVKFGNLSKLIKLTNPLKSKGALPTDSSNKKGRLGGFVVFSIFAVTFPFLTPLIALAFVAVVLYSSAFFVLIPFIGMSSGVTYIEKWVLEPQTCNSIQSTTEILKGIQERKKPKTKKSENPDEAIKTVVCAAVKKDGEEIARGRVVLQTSKAVLLLASDGQVRRVPTTDMVIELVGDIATQPDKPLPVKK